MIYRAECNCGRLMKSATHKTVKCKGCGVTIFIGDGLGDKVAHALDKVGGKQFKAAYKKVTGKDCGCGRRQKALNKLGDKLKGKGNEP